MSLFFHVRAENKSIHQKYSNGSQTSEIASKLKWEMSIDSFYSSGSSTHGRLFSVPNSDK